MGKIKIPSVVVKHRPLQKEKKSKVIQLEDITQKFAKQKAYWVKYILSLGYTKNQAEVFAERHTFYMVVLAELVKKQAVEFVYHMLGAGDEVSITMALLAARIDQEDINKRVESEKAGKKKTSKKPKGK
jgi:hypothetical protein